MKKLMLYFVFFKKIVGFLVGYPVFVFSIVNKLFKNTKDEKQAMQQKKPNVFFQKLNEAYMSGVYLIFSPFFALALFPFALLEFSADWHEYYHKEYLQKKKK